MDAFLNCSCFEEGRLSQIFISRPISLICNFAKLSEGYPRVVRLPILMTPRKNLVLKASLSHIRSHCNLIFFFSGVYEKNNSVAY